MLDLRDWVLGREVFVGTSVGLAEWSTEADSLQTVAARGGGRNLLGLAQGLRALSSFVLCHADQHP